MNNQLPSLTTADRNEGLELATALASELCNAMENRGDEPPHPGGTNYVLPQSAPRELVAAVLFYAIAAANRNWSAAA